MSQPLTFEKWMDEVNMAVHERTALRALDFPDGDYRVWYDDGLTPVEAAIEIVEAGI